MPNLLEHRLVVIEWVDWTMKSITTRSLAELYSWVYYKTGALLSTEEKKVLNSPDTNTQKRFDRYLEVVRQDIWSIQEIQASWQVVFADRLIDTTICHHISMDETVLLRDAPALSQSIKRIQILLTASMDRILKNISWKDVKSRFDLNEELIIATQHKLEQCRNDLVIDVSHGDPKKALDDILEHFS
jgi:hypothetical protein